MYVCFMHIFICTYTFIDIKKITYEIIIQYQNQEKNSDESIKTTTHGNAMHTSVLCCNPLGQRYTRACE